MTSPKEIAYALLVGILIIFGLIVAGIFGLWQWKPKREGELSKSWTPDAEAERQWKMRSRNEK